MAKEDKLKALDAGSHKGEEFKGAQIPTFVEFMDWIKDHPTMTLDVELKEYPTEGTLATENPNTNNEREDKDNNHKQSHHDGGDPNPHK